MADKKISELTDGVTPQDTDEFAIARAGSTLSLLWSALKGAVYAPSGTDVAVADGGTGASDASTARSNLAAAPAAAKYVVQTADSELSAEQALSALATGIVKNTTTTGVLSIAAEGTDYYGPGGTDVAVADGGTGASTASGARTNLGLAVGTDVQAHDADLDSIAALDSSTSGAIASDGAGWVKKTYSQFKTALSLVASDVGLGNVTNDAQLKAANLDTDGTLAANSDTKIASQKATKTYVDAHSGGVVLFDSTLAAAAASIDTGAGGIAAGHRVLEVWMILRTADANELSVAQITVNGDTGAHYDAQVVIGNGASVSASFGGLAANWGIEVPGATDEAGAAAVARLTIPGYDQTAFHKQAEMTATAPDPTGSNNRIRTASLRWKSTAAISQLTVTGAFGNFVAGSRLLILAR